MKISVSHKQDNNLELSLEGEFDAQGCKNIREKLEDITSECEGKTLFVNLKNVHFIDSSGIGAIVFMYKRVQAVDGKLHITHVNGQPQELMTLLRVHEAIPVSWENDMNDDLLASDAS